MVKIVLTPDWFLNNDVLIEVVVFMTLFLFFIFSMRSYKVTERKSILYLGIGFFLVALGVLSSILTKIVLYYDFDFTQKVGEAIITNEILTSVDIFYYAGFFFTRFFTLLGFYIIYKIPAERKLTTEFLLIIYLLGVIALLSQNISYLYYLTTFVLVFLIVRNYFRIYSENKLANTKILLIAFIILLFSQAMFIFSQINYFYVIAQSAQLVSYVILLWLIIKIQKNGTQEKQNRHSA